MCLELMKKMMRGVRICYFIEGYCELFFAFYFTTLELFFSICVMSEVTVCYGMVSVP